MKKALLGSILIPFISMAQQKENWDLYIQNDIEEWIPARISFEEKNGEKYLNIKNAEETIQLKPSKIANDSTYYKFIDYNAEIVFTKGSNNNLTGYWVNYESDPVKKRPVKATLHSNPFGNNRSANVNGSWKAVIKRETGENDAIIIFRQKEQNLYATIRTKSGDYRYLEGSVNGENFFLSSFSGNSLFYLKGKIENDTLKGRISGVKTNNITIEAVRDADFQLPDGKTLTKAVNEKPFQLDLKDEYGKLQNFKKLTENKVTIVSIFGTWCPNCVDEVNYFNELQKKFPGIEIICVSFEATNNEIEQQKRVQGFKARKNISLQFLIGGKADKENVMKKFPMIDNFGSYPTSFLIDKNGKIQEIYTGFNGPATGILYDRFKEELEGKIRELLK